MNDKFHTKSEVADATGLSIRTIERLVESGAIPSLKIGGRRLFVLEDVIAALIKIAK
ncbi:MAG: helix-turn-helix domain-containing protein [Verrucomicrobiales bacterium]|nr:helix-turn-helix domain-containing protein [Verrucomicrobiales bacterium]